MATNENANAGSEGQPQQAPVSAPATQNLIDPEPIRPRRYRSRLRRCRGQGTRVSRRRSRWRCRPTQRGYRFAQSLENIAEEPLALAHDIDFQAFELQPLRIPARSPPEADVPEAEMDAGINDSEQRLEIRSSIHSICGLIFGACTFVIANVLLLMVRLLGYYPPESTGR